MKFLENLKIGDKKINLLKELSNRNYQIMTIAKTNYLTEVICYRDYGHYKNLRIYIRINQIVKAQKF